MIPVICRFQPAAAAALCALTIAQLVACAPEPTQQLVSSARSAFKSPKLFDFDNYKHIFRKSYASREEELVRQQYFLSRAFRALISMVNYKAGRLSYFMALNKMSDRTNAELKRLENPLAGKLFEDAIMDSASDAKVNKRFESNSQELFPGDKLYEMLKRLKREYPESEDVAALVAEMKHLNQLKRRNVDRNKVNLDRLINSSKPVKSTDAFSKARKTSKYANPNHVAPELMSEGIKEQVRDVKLPDLYDRNQLIDYLLSNSEIETLEMYLEGLESDLKSRRAGEDRVFFDHRQSNCMWEPRDQMECGGCYAFAYITIGEWLHCNATGELLAFSEQYMIDCGRYVGMNGCDGGSPGRGAKFVHNFGFELLATYPYTRRDGECPYDEETDLETTGYIRVDNLKSAAVPVDRLAEKIQVSPMYLSISTLGSFNEYGGGVWDGAGCEPDGTHGVVLIGHGREDGQEYWLIKNSHSVGWGEGGYMKMAKNSDCIDPKFGFVIGFDNDRFHAKLRKNLRHDESKILGQFI